jgi:hypothetical protein
MKRKRPVWDDDTHPAKRARTEMWRRVVDQAIDRRKVCGNLVLSIIDDEYLAMLLEQIIISMEDKLSSTTIPNLKKYLPREIQRMKSMQDIWFAFFEMHINLVCLSS